MKRRQVLKGIIGATALGFTSYNGFNYLIGSKVTNIKCLAAYTTLIEELTEVIIPTTDTPGAKEAEVYKFVTGYVENCATKKEYRNFLNGLAEVETRSLERFGVPFTDCSDESKYVIVSELDTWFNNSIFARIDSKIRGKSFFNLLRDLTVEGYCTSYLGASEFLDYQHIPGEYLAVTDYKNTQKAWAIK